MAQRENESGLAAADGSSDADGKRALREVTRSDRVAVAKSPWSLPMFVRVFMRSVRVRVMRVTAMLMAVAVFVTVAVLVAVLVTTAAFVTSAFVDGIVVSMRHGRHLNFETVACRACRESVR
jgi:hypothetical protein